MKPKEIYIRAKEILHKRGWIQGSSTLNEDGCCIMGAVALAAGLPEMVVNNSGQDVYPWFEEHTNVSKPLAECAISKMEDDNMRVWVERNPSGLWAFNNRAKSIDEIFEVLDCAIEKVSAAA